VIYKNYLKYDNKWENITVENVPKKEKRNLRRNFELIIQYRIKKSTPTNEKYFSRKVWG
jgi:hypothetical protein